MSNQALGFNEICVVAPENSPLTEAGIMKAIHEAARERRITITAQGSDALDASRDSILAEAVQAAGGGGWEIADGDLYVAVPGLALTSYLP